MDDLVQFLRDRLDEDEVEARRGYLQAQPIPDYDGWNQSTTTGLPPAVAKRVLRDIEARRQIMDLHPYSTRRDHVGERWRKDPNPELDQTFCETCHVDDGIIQKSGGLPCMTLRLLALPYADHPDYREEWRP